MSLTAPEDLWAPRVEVLLACTSKGIRDLSNLALSLYNHNIKKSVFENTHAQIYMLFSLHLAVLIPKASEWRLGSLKLGKILRR